MNEKAILALQFALNLANQNIAKLIDELAAKQCEVNALADANKQLNENLNSAKET